MANEIDQLDEYWELLKVYLGRAVKMFGPKTDYVFDRLTYHNSGPITILSEGLIFEGIHGFEVKLNGHANHDRKDGVFQLSHEVVHLLSPIEQNEGDEVNYLEEGMATFFSRMITVEEHGDPEFCDVAIAKDDRYLNALYLYQKLISVDQDAVRKLRKHQPIIANILPETFVEAQINANEELISALLTKF